MATNVADLAAFRRSFVRGKGEPSDPEYDSSSDDTFFMGIVCAEMAANRDEIDCASCGSKNICRAGFGNPAKFGTVTTASGHLYGYALCEVCAADREASTKRIDAAFDAACGAKEGG